LKCRSRSVTQQRDFARRQINGFLCSGLDRFLLGDLTRDKVRSLRVYMHQAQDVANVLILGLRADRPGAVDGSRLERLYAA
jgi:hypothetical protein